MSHTDQYINRHIGNDDKETQDMLDAMGLKSLDELIDQTVPSAIRAPEGKGFEHRGKTIVGLDSESGVIRKMTQLAGINKLNKSY